MLVRYISEYLIGFPKSTTFDRLNTIELFLEWCCNILQHSFKISRVPCQKLACIQEHLINSLIVCRPVILVLQH